MNTHFRFRLPLPSSLQPNAVLLMLLVGAMFVLALRAGAVTSSVAASVLPTEISAGGSTHGQAAVVYAYAWQGEPPTDTPTPTPTPTPMEDLNPTQTATSTPGGPPTDTPTSTLTPTPEGPDVTPTEPPMEVYVSSVRARFFRNLSGCAFNVTTATPTVFTQSFPVIGFNPVANVIPCSVGVNQNTRPFTDVIPGATPTPCSTQRAEATVGATPTLVQAGVGTLSNFHAVFTGEINVPAGGNVTFRFYVDDSFVLGIGPKINGNGEQPTYVSGQFAPPAPPPPAPWPTTPFQGYRVVGRYNTVGGIGLRTVTVNFPTGGFYPFEVDYTECSGGSLELVIGTDARNPIPPGPSPTPTTNTPTPTPTPICVNPTPFAYPWCPSAPTATASPTAPSKVSSYYVQPTHTPPPGSTPTPVGAHSYWWNQGYKVADSMITSGGPQFGLAILGFGKPDVIYEGLDATWRVRVLGPWNPAIYLSIEEVQLLAGEFASGFYNRASLADTPPYIVVAIGTTNYWSPSRPLTMDEFYLHGYQWGDAVKKLNGKYQTYFPIVKFEGAYDVEFAWSPPEYALRWTQGFELATRSQCPLCREYYYYTYASCDDCYYPGSGGDPNDTVLENYHEEGPLMTWSLDQAVGVTVANRAALVLPQIYYPAGSIPTDQAGQWGWLASYAATHYLCLDEYRIPRGIPGKPAFQGSMADGTGAPALPAELAWQRLWMALNRQSCTSPNPSDMEYLTPIRYLPKP